MKILYTLVLIVLFSFLSSCTQKMIAPNNDASYNTMNLSSSAKKGYIAFSTLCRGITYPVLGEKYINLFYHAPFQVSDLISLDNDRINVLCNQQAPQYYLLELPAGKTRIFGITFTIFSTGKEFKPFDFIVLPGKVTYLGRFYFQAFLNHPHLKPNILIDLFSFSSVGSAKLGFINKASEDLPWFEQHYKQFSKDKVEINLPTNHALGISSEFLYTHP